MLVSCPQLPCKKVRAGGYYYIIIHYYIIILRVTTKVIITCKQKFKNDFRVHHCSCACVHCCLLLLIVAAQRKCSESSGT